MQTCSVWLQGWSIPYSCGIQNSQFLNSIPHFCCSHMMLGKCLCLLSPPHLCVVGLKCLWERDVITSCTKHLEYRGGLNLCFWWLVIYLFYCAVFYSEYWLLWWYIYFPCLFHFIIFFPRVSLCLPGCALLHRYLSKWGLLYLYQPRWHVRCKHQTPLYTSPHFLDDWLTAFSLIGFSFS